ncbi:XkdQ/YqbQ family protein [Paenibacillus arenosi]|uniref:YqbQ/XkdQ domain-containing protein n=1 Tax=Paenibacillus arenosi TaxID=2774142 RepID=A0ABR9B315_9BACL|nr:hypothetical protein [Paenibacillus arenosi]MBD8500745.1 hypothetical protein [Paenibacillus arenosi]
MKLIYKSRSGHTEDITALVTRITWSGTLSEAARKLEFSVLTSKMDRNLPYVAMEVGEVVHLIGENDQEIFQGYIFRKGKTLAGLEVSYSAYDRLIYLLKSSVSMKFKDLEADKIVKMICADLGVPVGKLPDSKVKLSFIHMGKTAYEAIMVAYTLVSKKTKGRPLYIPRMDKGKLTVVSSGEVVAKRMLSSASNLLDASYDEDIESMINVVRVIDQDGKLLDSVENKGWKDRYGKLQATVQKEDKKDVKTTGTAQLMGMQRTASAQVQGGPDMIDMITGHMIKMNHGLFGRTGLFFVGGDTHTFENGQHSIQLDLQFQKMMDERVAE